MTTRRGGGRPPLLVVLRALGVGDLLTAVPAMRGLAAAFPDHRRVLAAPQALEPLAMLTGAVDAVSPAQPLQALAHSLGSPDVAVNLHGRGPQSHQVLLSARPGRLISFHHADVPQSAGAPEWRAEEHEVWRWCRLLEESGVPADPSDLHIAPPRAPAPDEARGATLIHPGAASPARRWPPERWAAVARAELASGRRVVLTGSAAESRLLLDVAALGGVPTESLYAGRVDLGGLACLVAAAGRVVCGDTGVAHLATALRTPSVVLFGPTSPAHWGPPPDHRRHRVIWKGGLGDPHARYPDPGLLEIQVEDVLSALDEVPGARV